MTFVFTPYRHHLAIIGIPVSIITLTAGVVVINGMVLWRIITKKPDETNQNIMQKEPKNMRLVHVEEKEVRGLAVRTKNADEMNQQTAKIGGVWQKFYETVAPNLKDGTTIFGVYYDYESDATGEFNVLAGTDAVENMAELETIKIQAGNYLLFTNQGEMPQVVIDTWSEVWNYFSSADAKQTRAYTTDFERYRGPDEIEIYIAVI